jgi:hypothetical protein
MSCKKTIKIIKKQYLIEKDGKNSFYVSENGGNSYHYADFFDFNGIKVRVYNGGVNIYGVSQKIKRRIKGFLAKGYSVYALGKYEYRKPLKEYAKYK